ncbi:MAG: hypothetical protein ABSE63_08180 [Thermoguttaceae bacterium]|jgi:hypothetical protein
MKTQLSHKTVVRLIKYWQLKMLGKIYGDSIIGMPNVKNFDSTYRDFVTNHSLEIHDYPLDLIAKQLNQEGFRTATNRPWTRKTVAREFNDFMLLGLTVNHPLKGNGCFRHK